MGLQESTRHLLQTDLDRLEDVAGARLKRLVLALVNQRLAVEDYLRMLELELHSVQSRLTRWRDEVRTWTEQAVQAVAQGRDKLARVALKKTAELNLRRTRGQESFDDLQLQMEEFSVHVEQLNAKAREAFDRIKPARSKSTPIEAGS